jgi:large subunit ribosomal protein L14
MTRGLVHGSVVPTCDNSGAKMVRIVTVVGQKTVKRRMAAAAVGDLLLVSVQRGRPDMRKQVVYGVLVRQKKDFRRPDGMRVKFEDNAVVVLKDDKGNPKGTIFKGPVAKEACTRWPGIAKVASVIV